MTATLDWAGCATFRLTAEDLVVFLDAYLDRPETAAPTGFSVDAVERADWILVGHSHADHLWGAERIAVRTGATIIGSYETVRVMSALGVPESQLACVSGGERIRLGGDVTVRVFPGLHSCVWAGSPRDAGEADTAGYWTPVLGRLRPDVAILGAAGRGNIDGEPVQGSLAGFIARQADLLRPARLLLSHHDDWMPGLTSVLDTTPVREALAERAPATELVEIGYRSGYPLFGSIERVSTTA